MTDKNSKSQTGDPKSTTDDKESQWIVIGDGGLYCQVPFSEDKVMLETLIFQIAEKGVINLPYKKLQSILRDQKGTRIKISGFPEPFKFAELCQLRFNDDETEVYLTVRRFKSVAGLNFFGLIYYLINRGIKFGIDFIRIDEIAHILNSDNDPVENVLVAKGYPPIPGKNAIIKHRFDPNRELAPLIKNDGRVDYKNLDLIQCVLEGELLIEKKPATRGKDGRTVRGYRIPTKPGVDRKIQGGRNTTLSLDGNKLLAASNGNVYFRNGIINIEKNYVVKGNVDFSTGNLEFEGDIFIQGRVLPEFTVSATGDIEIFQDVEGGIITSREGSIKIKGGINGKDISVIKAGKNVEARFIEKATVEAGNDIIASFHIISSRVRAGKKIIVQRGNGLIAGGSVYAGEEISILEAGKPNTETLLHLASPRYLELQTEQHEIIQKIKMMNKLLESQKKKFSQASVFVKTESDLQKARGDKIKALNTRLDEIKKEIIPLRKGAITVVKGIMPGTILNFYGTELKIEKYKNGATWRLFKGKIKEESAKK